ncbi:MAG: tetratricopeptide repeat protein [Gammaproteobacteria bacterium]
MKSNDATLCRIAVAFLLAAAVGGCATSQGTRRVWPPDEQGVVGRPAPPVSEPVPQPVLPGLAGEDARPEYPRTPDEVSSAAVTALMRQARAALDSGKPDQASAALERALRIEPRNYFVWSMLGQVYLAQNNYSQAASVADKSNALARGNVYVELENWRTIAAARRATGDAAGAEMAQARVADLERWLYARSAP